MSDSEKEAYSEEEDDISSSSYDSSEEYISKDELIKELETLINIVKTKRVSRSFLQDIHDSIEEYITGEIKVLDPQVVNYIIQGWLVSNNIHPHANSLPGSGSFLCPRCITQCHYTLKNEVN
jgi:hypothetical protein